MYYFGSWDDLHAGRTPRVQGEGLTVRDLVNRFLTSQRHLLDIRAITPPAFQEYYDTCEWLVGAFAKTRLSADLAADDFERLPASRQASQPRRQLTAMAQATIRLRVMATAPREPFHFPGSARGHAVMVW